MEIVLVRHGATDWNLQRRCQGSSDLELNRIGIRQAKTIASQLAPERVDGIYSSHLKRARQTAELISRPHRLPVNIEEDIRELDHGDLEGLTFEQVHAEYGAFLQRWRTEPAELRVPGGERLVDVAERSWSGLNRIVHGHRPGGTIVVVSHNFPILAILCRVTGTPLNQYRSFRLDPCGVTRLSHTGSSWLVTQVNGREYPLATANGRDPRRPPANNRRP